MDIRRGVEVPHYYHIFEAEGILGLVWRGDPNVTVG
tara:strand:+ start:549 stop:656 length:108 start_codon:yes stop_codon:yes gene_type:complete